MTAENSTSLTRRGVLKAFAATTLTAAPTFANAFGLLRGAGDILLVPDPATFRPLPWSPHSAWLLCDAHFKSGAPIPFAPRSVLRTALDRLGAEVARGDKTPSAAADQVLALLEITPA